MCSVTPILAIFLSVEQLCLSYYLMLACTTGGHYMTGPIYVCGAEPGDVLEVCFLHCLT